MNQLASDHRHSPDASLKALAHIPGKAGVPILGMTPALFRDFYGTINKHHAQYGLVSKIGIGLQKGVLVLGPQSCQHLLLDPERNFSSQMGYRDTAGTWFGGAILSRDFDDPRRTGWLAGQARSRVHAVHKRAADERRRQGVLRYR
jgi:hypothetical protein